MFQDHICSYAIDLNCFIFMNQRIELSDAIAQIINGLSAIQTVKKISIDIIKLLFLTVYTCTFL